MSTIRRATQAYFGVTLKFLFAIIVLGLPFTAVDCSAQIVFTGAHVYLFSVGSNGPNTGSQSLISGSGTYFDSNGNGYVVTDSNGKFSLAGMYTCPAGSDAQVYVASVGGSSSGGGSNPYHYTIAALPVTCSKLSTLPSINITEATTVAAAFALASFADNADDGFSTTSTSSSALASAFSYANALVSSHTGLPIYDSNYPAVVKNVDTLADVLAACDTSSGGTICQQLMSAATVNGQQAPNDILRAVLNIVLNPTSNISQIYALVPAEALYQPVYSSAPTTWQMPSSSAPIISSTSVSTNGGSSNLMISGANFLVGGAGNTTVVVGGLASPIQTVTSTTIATNVPATASSGIVQVYSGNQGSNPAALVKLASTTSLTLSPTTSQYGSSFNVIVSVGSNISTRPTGSVTCSVAGQSQTESLTTGTTSSTATFTFSNVAVGAQTVSCVYAGSTLFAGSAATAVEQVTSPLAAVSVTIVASPTSTTYGDVVTLSSTVAPQSSSLGTPTGTITFTDGGVSVSTVQLLNGTAVFTDASLSIGSHTVTAHYSGDSQYQTGVSSSVTVTVSGQPVTCPTQ